MTKSDIRERVTEDELAKRATAERVTLEQVEGSIEGEWYFTGSQAIRSDEPEDLSRVTICLLRMMNGFIVLGHSAPASAANFDAEIGKRLARERAIMQIWQLLGFELKTQQWRRSVMENQVPSSGSGYVDALVEKLRNQEGNSTSNISETGIEETEGLATPGSKPEKTNEINEIQRGKLGAED
jgi:hypothetical protein